MRHVRALVGHLAELVESAVRSFVTTLLATIVYGCVLLQVGLWLLGDGPSWSSGLTLIVFCESLAAGLILGIKRAVLGALLEGLRRLRIARSMAELLFERLLAVDDVLPAGGRRNQIANFAERIPLAQAEQRLKDAASYMAGVSRAQPGPGAWLRRRLERKLMRMIEFYTLTRFRETGAASGGVDLLKLSQEIEGRIDAVLIGKIRLAMNLWTVVVLLVLAALIGCELMALVSLGA